MPNALPRSFGSVNVVVISDSAAGTSSAANAPWQARAVTSMAKLTEAPPMAETPAKPTSPVRNVTFRPSRSASRPPSRSRLPKAKVYAVTTHCRSTAVKCSARWADGSAMFITVRSRTTISCAMPITPKISHRRRPRPLLTVVASDMRLTTSFSSYRVPCVGQLPTSVPNVLAECCCPSNDGAGALLLLQQAVGEDDLDDGLDRVLAGPVALQFDCEGDPADRLPAGLDHAVKAGAVGLGGGAADRVHDGGDLMPFAQRVEGGEGHADFGPQGAEDELTAPGRADGLDEFDVLPGVGRGPVERLVVGQQGGKFGQRGLSPAGGDVDGRVHDWDLEGLDGPDRRDGVLDQEVTLHRADPGQLRGLVVDEQERRVLGSEEMVGDGVAHRGTGHGSGTFWEQGLVRPKLAAMTVTGCHPIP